LPTEEKRRPDAVTAWRLITNCDIAVDVVDVAFLSLGGSCFERYVKSFAHSVPLMGSCSSVCCERSLWA